MVGSWVTHTPTPGTRMVASGHQGAYPTFTWKDSSGRSRNAKELEERLTKLAAEGQRGFSLDGYARDSHAAYRFYDDEPPYEHVRAEVKQIRRQDGSHQQNHLPTGTRERARDSE